MLSYNIAVEEVQSTATTLPLHTDNVLVRQSCVRRTEKLVRCVELIKSILNEEEAVEISTLTDLMMADCSLHGR